jgi:hypothetical protein
MVESMLAQMSLHSTETEIETLLGAIYDLENEPSPHVAAANAAALAERYVRDIGDLSAKQRALLRAALALYAHGDATESCNAALAGFVAILSKLRRRRW